MRAPGSYYQMLAKAERILRAGGNPMPCGPGMAGQVVYLILEDQQEVDLLLRPVVGLTRASRVRTRWGR